VVSADDFFLGHYTTTLDDDECLLRVDIPTATSSAGWAVQEVARRHGDFALVGVVAMVALDPDARIEQARLCLFGVGERPLRVPTVESSLVGATATTETFALAAADATRDLTPGSDMHGTGDYRRHLAQVTVRRALVAASERARHIQEGARS
jgi:carbon-monoxide dehydrogenase medium subunit